MQSAPGGRPSTSSREVCAFMQTIRSTSFLRAIHPSLFARIVNHVGRPAMFDGNMFLPLTGTPIWKMERIRTLLDDCDPDPFTVATWIVKSLTTGAPPDGAASRTASAVRVSVTSFSLGWISSYGKKRIVTQPISEERARAEGQVGPAWQAVSSQLWRR